MVASLGVQLLWVAVRVTGLFVFMHCCYNCQKVNMEILYLAHLTYKLIDNPIFDVARMNTKHFFSFVSLIYG